jgi:hypothetical protein
LTKFSSTSKIQMNDRIDVITGIAEDEAIDPAAPFFGFVVEGRRQIGEEQLKSVVHRESRIFDNPLSNFKDKLLETLRHYCSINGKNYKEIEKIVIERFELISRNDELIFEARRLVTGYDHIEAWDITAVENTTIKVPAGMLSDKPAMIKPIPARICLVTDLRATVSNTDALCNVLGVSWEAVRDCNPFYLIAKSTEYEDYDGIHYADSLLLDIMSIALNLEPLHLHWRNF